MDKLFPVSNLSPSWCSLKTLPLVPHPSCPISLFVPHPSPFSCSTTRVPCAGRASRGRIPAGTRRRPLPAKCRSDGLSDAPELPGGLCLEHPPPMYIVFQFQPPNPTQSSRNHRAGRDPLHRVLALSPESFSQCLHWNRLSSPKFLSFGVICLEFYTLGALYPIPRGGQPPPGTEVGVVKGTWGFSPLPPRSGRGLEVNPGGFGWGFLWHWSNGGCHTPLEVSQVRPTGRERGWAPALSRI